MRLLRIILAAALILASPGYAPGPALAGPASLVADRVQVLGSSRIVAEGNVLVAYNGFRLTARRVVYDKYADELIIDGPITLSDADGGMAVFADAAQLSTDLRDGLMTSARLVLEQQLQIAAVEITRIQGRYTQASKVVASSCKVCAAHPTPLWQIRAREVIHDQEEGQLYFRGAQLRVLDLPVFYLPRLRLPDPANLRSTGFLPPRLWQSGRLGLALRAPYFIALGDHADLTVAPLVSPRTKTLEARYRQAFRFGRLDVNGAVSRDTLLPGATRYYLFAEGHFTLPHAFRLDIEIQQASDPTYGSDYDYFDQTRLRNAFELSRARRDEYVYAGIVHTETLRAGEIPFKDQLPFTQGDLIYERRLPGIGGGELTLGASAHGHARLSSVAAAGSGVDGIVSAGHDQGRLSAEAHWQRDWIMSNGMIVSFESAVQADAFGTYQDAGFAARQSQIVPAAALSLGWPVSRMSAGGSVDVLEPVVQIAWSGGSVAAVANEDSVMAELDPANLFDLSRFPGHDAYERGLRANLGLSWTRLTPEGWSFTLAGGRVIRRADLGQFSAASGLDGQMSDWLVAGQIASAAGFALQSRALIAPGFGITKAETRAAWHSAALDLATGHMWVIADPAENRAIPTHEWMIDAAYQLTPGWRASVDWRYNLTERAATQAELGLEYQNECVKVDLSLTRRFTTIPTTNVGFSVTLTGFGGSGSGPSRPCRG
jgi:LPS-assembly protein